MKVAIFTPTFLPKTGGAEIFHHNLAVRLGESGDEVTVILPTKLHKQLLATGWPLPYRILPFPSNLFSYFRRWPALARLLAGWKLGQLQASGGFDVWHTVMFYPTAPALVPWAEKHRIPHLVRSAGDDVVSSRDGSIGLRDDIRTGRLIRDAMRDARCVVALSTSIEREFLSAGVRPERIRTIPNAVDSARFREPVDKAAVRKRAGVNADGFLFLAVGRNSPQKNYPALIAAARILKKQEHVFQILLVGRDMETLRNEIRDSELESIFRFTHVSPPSGGLPDFPPRELIDLFCSADAFVMPSLLEGFSTALLEAMCAGLPVITTDAPGCRDFVREGKDALMVPAGDEAALANAMAEVLTDLRLRESLTQKSLSRAEEFSWERVVQAYRETYADLVREMRIARS